MKKKKKKKEKIEEKIYIFVTRHELPHLPRKGNDMSTTFLQQILNGRLLLVIIVRAKK